MSLSIVFLTLCLLRDSLGLPEQGVWKVDISKDSFKSDFLYSFQKTLSEGSNIDLKISCKSTVPLVVVWSLFESPCLEEFGLVNPTTLLTMQNLTSSFQPLVQVHRNTATVKLSCSSDSPIQPLKGYNNLTRWDGSYLLLVKVICSDDTNCDTTGSTLQLEMKYPDGSYLSLVERPFRPFFAVLFTVYLLLAVTWSLSIICYWSKMQQLQMYLGGIITIGLLEQMLRVIALEQLHRYGATTLVTVFSAEFFGCLKRSLARFQLLILCLGYGVTKPRIGSRLSQRILIFILFYTVIITTEVFIRFSHPRFGPTQAVLIALVLTSLVDVALLCYCFACLVRTLRETRTRHRGPKYDLYRSLSNLLLVSGLVSVSFMIWSIYMFKWTPCIRSWRYLWLDEAFWQFLFVCILIYVLWLFRPSATNSFYSYTILHPSDGGTDEEIVQLALQENNEEGVDHDEDIDLFNAPPDSKVSAASGDKRLTDLEATSVPKVPPSIPPTMFERFGTEALSGPSPTPVVWKME